MLHYNRCETKNKKVNGFLRKFLLVAVFGGHASMTDLEFVHGSRTENKVSKGY